MRTVSADVTTALGTEPIIAIRIQWTGSGTGSWYSDRDTSISGASQVKGKLLEINGLGSTVVLTGSYTVDDVGFVLDDTDGSIKEWLKTEDIHKKPVEIYQAFEDTGNKFLLFKGELVTPIEWDEGTCRVSLHVETTVEAAKIGYSPDQGAFEYLDPASVGKVWPLGFGEVVRVPAMRITERQRGKSLTRFSKITPAEITRLCDIALAYGEKRYWKEAADDFDGLAYTHLNEYYYTQIVDSMSTAYVGMLQYQEALILQNQTLRIQIITYSDLCDSIGYDRQRLIEIDNYIYTIQVALDRVAEKLAAFILARAIADPTPPNPENPVDPAVIQYLDETIDELINQTEALEQSLFDQTEAYGIVNTAIAENEAAALILQLFITQADLVSMEIESDYDFGVDPVEIIVNGRRFLGTFSGNTFTVTESELPTYADLDTEGIPDKVNEFNLVDSGNYIQDNYCLIYSGGEYRVVYILKQIGGRCIFKPVLWEKGQQVDDRFAYNFHTVESGVAIIREVAPTILSNWFNHLNTNLPATVTGLRDAEARDWTVKYGDLIYLADGSGNEREDIWVVNEIPSDSIAEVVAYRTLEGRRELHPVPTDYYTSSLNDLDIITGKTPTTIRTKRRLSEYRGENWENQIYVSYTSSEGPNVVDIIRWCVETYTDDTLGSTFNTGGGTVHDSLTNYPAGFALRERKNVINFVLEVAWQSRCALVKFNDEWIISYVSEDSSPANEVTEDEIENATMVVSTTGTEDLITEFIAQWRIDYTDEGAREIVLRNNIPKYGLLTQEFDFYIYNIEELVVKSATFWMLRYSNIWKKIKFGAFLDKLDTVPTDQVTLNFADDFVSSVDVTGFVESVTYDSDSFMLLFDVWVPVRIGENTEYTFAYAADALEAAEWPSGDDILYAGGEASG